MRFRISPLEAILKEAQLMMWDDTKQAVAQQHGGARHRASVDAMIIQQTYAKVMERSA
ncbi:hypothetical protein [Alteromonas oceanisediminis]|uniref:hypothetical protein n=1 Tax=Alteromonas oceanisediminis TaxID=2836180 RepID=UPI0028F43956|nr:hypothetical protein [Alteromonas oceanisediminis]